MAPSVELKSIFACGCEKDPPCARDALDNSVALTAGDDMVLKKGVDAGDIP